MSEDNIEEIAVENLPPKPPEDPYAERREAITAAMGVHKEWAEMARGVKTVEAFAVFHDLLMNSYAHDRTTLVHAIAALALAGACLGVSDPIGGAITGSQAGGVMWEFLSGWGTGPANIGRMLDFEQMLFPQYERRFNVIGAENWAFLQKRAAELIARDDAEVDEKTKAPPRLRAWWQDIVAGKVPFGWMLAPEVPSLVADESREAAI